jgi:hypothetical protein
MTLDSEVKAHRMMISAEARKLLRSKFGSRHHNLNTDLAQTIKNTVEALTKSDSLTPAEREEGYRYGAAICAHFDYPVSQPLFDESFVAYCEKHEEITNPVRAREIVREFLCKC